jgi:hypothetical protein
MPELLTLLLRLVFLGVPGLVAGVLVGRWSRSWKVVIALVAVGLLVVVVGLASIPDDPDDDDPGLGYAIGAFANFAGWTLGLVASKARRKGA